MADNPAYREQIADSVSDSVRVIAEWLADRWGYETPPEACWNDARELADRLAHNANLGAHIDSSGTNRDNDR